MEAQETVEDEQEEGQKSERVSKQDDEEEEDQHQGSEEENVDGDYGHQEDEQSLNKKGDSEPEHDSPILLKKNRSSQIDYRTEGEDEEPAEEGDAEEDEQLEEGPSEKQVETENEEEVEEEGDMSEQCSERDDQQQESNCEPEENTDHYTSKDSFDPEAEAYFIVAMLKKNCNSHRVSVIKEETSGAYNSLSSHLEDLMNQQKHQLSKLQSIPNISPYKESIQQYDTGRQS